jgi:hypothetical protein
MFDVMYTHMATLSCVYLMVVCSLGYSVAASHEPPNALIGDLRWRNEEKNKRQI